MSVLLPFSILGAPGDDALDVADVFSTDLYTGNGSTQTITNGIDLAGEGGLVWQKCRSTSQGHYIVDTERGHQYWIESQSTSAQQTALLTTNVTSFDSTGFTLGGDYSVGPNVSGRTYAAWSFRRAPKFFDVVTFTTNGSGQATVSHSLGTNQIGCVFIKSTVIGQDWKVVHRGFPSTGYYATLNSTAAATDRGTAQYSATDTTITFLDNLNSTTAYVAYLFAHDTSDSGIIQCGSYTGNGSSSSGPTITLGWEPQWVMIKGVDSTYSGESHWYIFDAARGIPSGDDPSLEADTSSAENATTGSNDLLDLTSTGFRIATNASYLNNSGDDFIYIAIRAEGA